MHASNGIFWKHVSVRFSEYFNENILEFGSYNINGTIRDYFNSHKIYIGIDWRSGPCVDVVGLAHEVNFDFKAKAILSASMLEHDPYWKESLDNMINYLSSDGIFVLTWGAAKNIEHCFVEAPDGRFHGLKAEKVINYLKNKNMFIHTSIYDNDLHHIISDQCDLNTLSKERLILDGKGEFNLIAFNSKSAHDFKDGFISILYDEDKI